MLAGENAISICPIRTAMSCRSPDRSNDLENGTAADENQPERSLFQWRTVTIRCRILRAPFWQHDNRTSRARRPQAELMKNRCIGLVPRWRSIAMSAETQSGED